MPKNLISIEQVIKNALIERGWKIDPNAKPNPDGPKGELMEFIHPKHGWKRAWLGAIYDQIFIEYNEFDEETNKNQDIHNADNRCEED